MRTREGCIRGLVDAGRQRAASSAAGTLGQVASAGYLTSWSEERLVAFAKQLLQAEERQSPFFLDLSTMSRGLFDASRRAFAHPVDHGGSESPRRPISTTSNHYKGPRFQSS